MYGWIVFITIKVGVFLKFQMSLIYLSNKPSKTKLIINAIHLKFCLNGTVSLEHLFIHSAVLLTLSILWTVY